MKKSKELLHVKNLNLSLYGKEDMVRIVYGIELKE